jgi:hypothetical protein
MYKCYLEIHYYIEYCKMQGTYLRWYGTVVKERAENLKNIIYFEL